MGTHVNAETLWWLIRFLEKFEHGRLIRDVHSLVMSDFDWNSKSIAAFCELLRVFPRLCIVDLYGCGAKLCEAVFKRICSGDTHVVSLLVEAEHDALRPDGHMLEANQVRWERLALAAYSNSPSEETAPHVFQLVPFHDPARCAEMVPAFLATCLRKFNAALVRQRIQPMFEQVATDVFGAWRLEDLNPRHTF